MKFLRKVSYSCFALDGAATYPTSVWDGDSGNRDSDDGVQAAPDHRDWARMLAEIQATQTRIDSNNSGADDDTIDSVGTLETVTGLTVVEKGSAGVHKTILTLVDVTVASVDNGANGAQTNKKLYTFPQGHIVILGGHQVYPIGKIIATTGGGTGYLDNANLGIGVGSTVPATGVGLATTAENMAAEADVDLSSKASDAAESSVNAAMVPLDGSTTAVAVYCNTSTLADADHGATADELTISGTITILWTNIGDN